MSQNKNQDKNKNQDIELNTMNITDDAFGLSDEMIQAYMDANAIETPDLWARVESGFDNEVKMMQQEMMTDNVQPSVAKPNTQTHASMQMQSSMQMQPNTQTQASMQMQSSMQMQPSMQTQASMQMQSSMQMKPSMQMQPSMQRQSSMQMQPSMQTQPSMQRQSSMQQTKNTTGNVIDFSKRTARKKSIAAIAAIVILCIIAVPVMKMVGGNRQEDKGDSKETTTAEIYDDTTANSDDMMFAGESENQSEKENETDNCEQAEHSVAEGNEGGQCTVVVKAKGNFVYDGEKLLFEIESMESSPIGSIDKQARILLYDSDAIAAKYFEKVDGKSAYGPFVVQINVDEGTINSEQPEGVLVEQQSISK